MSNHQITKPWASIDINLYYGLWSKKVLLLTLGFVWLLSKSVCDWNLPIVKVVEKSNYNFELIEYGSKCIPRSFQDVWVTFSLSDCKILT